jgi:hypothetical protein
LLSVEAHKALLHAISRFYPLDSVTYKVSVARALKNLGAACADVVGPSLWGIDKEYLSLKVASQAVLDELFTVSSVPADTLKTFLI